MNKILSDKKTIALLIIPGFILMLAGVIFPIIMSGYMSVHEIHGFNTTEFVGLANYARIFTGDKVFWNSLFHALILALAYILIQHPLTLFCALMLDKIGGKAEKIFRVLIFIPCVISVVVTSKMWENILNPTFGLLNNILGAIGLEGLQHNWLSDPKTALGSVIFIIIWQGFGYGMLIYYAGVKGISKDINEACSIDGAVGLKKFFRVTLPMLMPVILVNVTLAFITALKQMETIFLTTNGGPGNTSQFLANYLYRQAFRNFNYGYANAISVMFVVFCLIFTIVYGRVMKREE